MNSVNIHILSFIIIDDNNQIIPASELFVFQGIVELYGCACMPTFKMNPGMSAANVEFGWGNLFLSPPKCEKMVPKYNLVI